MESENYNLLMGLKPKGLKQRGLEQIWLKPIGMTPIGLEPIIFLCAVNILRGPNLHKF